MSTLRVRKNHIFAILGPENLTVTKQHVFVILDEDLPDPPEPEENPRRSLVSVTFFKAG